jgi:hypothetical protein
MTRKSVETQTALVRSFEATGSYAKSARRLKLGRTTVLRWLQASAEAEDAGDTSSDFYIEIDGEADYLHSHMRAHLDAAVEDVEAGLIKMASEGYYVARSYHGQTVYKLDPQFIGWTDEDMKMLGYSEADRYLKDADGNLVPELEWCAPTVERQLAVLAAHSDKWKKHSRVDLNTHVSGGVAVQHWLPGQQSQPKQLPQSKPLPQVEVLPDEVIEQVVEDDEEPAQPEPMEAPEPAPVVRAPPEVRRAGNRLADELAAFAQMTPSERAAAALARQSRGK